MQNVKIWFAFDVLLQVDPLDAFMAEINEEMKSNKPSTANTADDLACDEEDHVADYLEVRTELACSRCPYFLFLVHYGVPITLFFIKECYDSGAFYSFVCFLSLR